MSKKALGKGIGALLRDLEDAKDAPDVIQVPLDSLKSNPYQPRTVFPEDRVKELADSIRTNGVIQPILVEADRDGTYTIIAGERRYKASKMAGLERIPVLVRKFSTEEKIGIALIENIQRDDLTPVEEALGYKRLSEVAELNQEEIARRVGKNRSTIANTLRLLRLPEEMLQALNNADITSGHARAILSCVNPSDQKILFERILKQNLSVRQTEIGASELNRGKRLPAAGRTTGRTRRIEPAVQDIEQKLIDYLGTKVRIQGTLDRGKIEISYFSRKDLERLMELLG